MDFQDIVQLSKLEALAAFLNIYESL